MKYFKIILCLIILVFLSKGCISHTDDLDKIKQYHPDKKYFKAGMKNLFFRIETNETFMVDSTMKQFFDKYEIPTNASGCADGVYSAESPYDAFDYKHIITIQIQNESIITVNYDEVSKNNAGKRTDKKYNQEMSRGGASLEDAYPFMEKELLLKQDIQDVDAVSGATYSLFRFRYVMGIALMKAKIETKNKLKQG